ncbi:hypothetical protein QFC21_004893 [Naganishia friedmannii]|uniref:Uncharacterized protein n=1 Tax=Naganishia friedmannii TaxID=89922 RepID=A0ACC2VCV9_9TREE|nr:hypothetical protein QFC21_004893 [Naganishia friedmannii]
MTTDPSDLDFLNAILARPAQQAAPPPHPSASTVPNDTDLPPNDTAANGSSADLGTTGVPQDILRSLEGLSTEERAAFAPLLQALSSAPSGTSGSGQPGPEISIKDVQDMLTQFDAAESVADTLEGKLDKLLESLEEVEDAFPEEQDPTKRESGSGGPKAGKGVGPQQLPETMAGEAKQAFEAVAKDRD